MMSKITLSEIFDKWESPIKSEKLAFLYGVEVGVERLAQDMRDAGEKT